jgi:hypothetical protein
MAKMFEDIQIGDQLELLLGRCSVIYGAGKDYDPNKVVGVVIVTDIWYDPVDAKEYVGLAKLRGDGSYGKPTEKRTLTGLARTGYRKARQDWIEHIRKIRAADKTKVLSFRRKS